MDELLGAMRGMRAYEGLLLVGWLTACATLGLMLVIDPLLRMGRRK